MKEIKGKVVSYCDIPVELVSKGWVEDYFLDYPSAIHVECYIDDSEEYDDLDTWLMKNYPGIEEDTFYIEIDC